MVGGFLWGIIAFEVIIPHFYPGAQSNNFMYRYASLGNTPGQIILNLLLHPWLIFTTFVTSWSSLLPDGSFPQHRFSLLARARMAVGRSADLAVNLLSTDPLTYSGVYHYNATIIPFVMFSAILGTRRLTLIWQQWRGEQSKTIPILLQTSQRAEPQDSRTSQTAQHTCTGPAFTSPPVQGRDTRKGCPYLHDTSRCFGFRVGTSRGCPVCLCRGPDEGVSPLYEPSTYLRTIWAWMAMADQKGRSNVEAL